MNPKAFEDKRTTLFFLMLIAYTFSIALRMIWVWQFQDNPEFYWNGQMMINTNDGYYFASGAEYLLNGLHGDNHRALSAIHEYPVLVYLTYYLTKLTSLSLETIILYLPAVISSLIVIPLLLIGRLIGRVWLGFFSAILGAVVWSYYNRTMVGYYDTDMFSVLFLYIVFWAFLYTLYQPKLSHVWSLVIALLFYPYVYHEGMIIAYTLFVFWVIYQMIWQRENRDIYLKIILVSITFLGIPLWIAIPMVLVVYLTLGNFAVRLSKTQLTSITLFFLILSLVGSDLGNTILSELQKYLGAGHRTQGLHFYLVTQTIREAGHIPWETVANRISGHNLSFVLSLVGYALLSYRYHPFLLAIPLIGIGIFAFWGGLRFTVYAVPIAALGVMYLFSFLAEQLTNSSWGRLALMVVATLALLYPNYLHIRGYRVPTVFSRSEVADLDKLKHMASPKDYTLSWWDYGYPIWFYAGTNTLIDGGKHNNDNFIISKIMQTSSPQLAASLSRLAVETYEENNYSVVINTLLHNSLPDQKDPNLFLAELESDKITLPHKTRDIYLYMPYKMIGIFPTVMVFGNLDLTTGHPLRKIEFYPTSIAQSSGGSIMLRDGILLDLKKGTLQIGKTTQKLKQFVLTQNTQNNDIRLQIQNFHLDGRYTVVYLKTYGRIIVMDNQTFHSMYVQMFMLGKYDPKYFEPVVTSPYSRIYKLKI